MGRPKGTRKVEIQRAAAELFAKNGYHATGVQEVSTAVGIGRGALYHHIGSKEALLYEIVTREIVEVIGLGRALLDEDSSAEDKLRRLSRAQMLSLAGNLAEWTVFQRDAFALQGAVREQIVARRDEYEEIWAQLFEQGVQAGEFRRLDPVVIKGILGMHNYAYLWIRGDGRLTPEEIADHFCDVVLGGVRAAAG